ncbi:hypothetical protein Tsedi_00623 [Tepidimonas sediminis]|uniref:Uncharacterized protein n=1 Tax=Tepidimonas sediminis TaxID=2588941 RepID=A0A554WTM0_9BURK|nr:hypothetical protein [Tepidimonas sediminis]TSE26913.1 hypothetical protein Tsedi_00623 [Tepidimonas sediminis]
MATRARRPKLETMADIRGEAAKLYRTALAGRMSVRDATALAHLLRVIIETLKAEPAHQGVIVIERPRAFG